MLTRFVSALSPAELQALQESLALRRDQLKRQIAVMEWVNRVPTLVFSSLRNKVESRTRSFKPLLGSQAADSMRQLRQILDVTPWLPQTLLVAALKLAATSPKHKPFIQELLQQFSTNYLAYLEAQDDKKVLRTIPHYFVEDVKQGMDVELLRLLVDRNDIYLLSIYLNAMQIPETVDGDLISKVIEVDPALMTSRLAKNYTAAQVVQACDQLIAKGDATLLGLLLRSVTTRIYAFSDIDRLVKVLSENQMEGSFARLLALIRPASLSPVSNATIAKYFVATSQWSLLQNLLLAQNCDVAWLQDADLTGLLNKLHAARFTTFCFAILSRLSKERVIAVKPLTVDVWVSSTSAMIGRESQPFIMAVSDLLNKFNLTLPSEPLRTPPPTESVPLTSTFKLPELRDSSTASTLEQQQRSELEKEQHFALEAEKNRLLLLLQSQRYPANDEKKEKAWDHTQRLEHIRLVQRLRELQQGEPLPLRVWASLVICLRAESTATTHRAELDSIYREFENHFMQRKPKLTDEEDRAVMGLALTQLAQHFWADGRHSAAMSVANILTYYKLRTDRNFEVLIREQAAPDNAVHGIAPLAWLQHVVDATDVDLSFFNSLSAVLQASIKFDLNAAIAEGAIPPQHLARAKEVWNSLIKVWTKARAAGWAPSSDFMSLLFKLARLQHESPSFYLAALKYCHSKEVSLAPSDLPLLHVLQSLLDSSNYQLGQYMLSSSGLNMLTSLPATVGEKKALLTFIMRSLATAQDHNNAVLAYRLFSGSSEQSYSIKAHALVDAFYQRCRAFKSFAVAEKFFRGIVSIHGAPELYLQTIQLAGQCGDINSAVRIYQEAVAAQHPVAPLTATILQAVVDCQVLPLEARRLMLKLEHPDTSHTQQRELTDSFIASIGTRRSNSLHSNHVTL